MKGRIDLKLRMFFLFYLQNASLMRESILSEMIFLLRYILPEVHIQSLRINKIYADRILEHFLREKREILHTFLWRLEIGDATHRDREDDHSPVARKMIDIEKSI